MQILHEIGGHYTGLTLSMNECTKDGGILNKMP